MEDLDFTPAPRDRAYEPAVALSFFETAGAAVNVADGQMIFAQDQPSDQMFLLREGQVRLVRSAKTLDIIKPGEIFGELAVITGFPRAAAAIARGDCHLVSINARQFGDAIGRAPEFALMLMGVLINRLRLSSAILGRAGGFAERPAAQSPKVFDRAMLERLAGAPSQRPPQRVPANRVIMEEGQVGHFMYVVMEGTVAVSIKSRVIERVEAGGIFGEMALVDRSPRAATAAAESETLLLSINRNDFLSLVRTTPGFAMALLKSLAERLRQMAARTAR